MTHDTQNQPLQHFIEVLEIKYPQSVSTWTAPAQEWRHYAQAIVLTSGRAKAQFKRDQLTLTSPNFIWLPPGLLQTIDFFPGAHAWLMTVSDEWLIPAVSNQPDKDIPFRMLADTLHSCQVDSSQSNSVETCLRTIQSELFTNQVGSRSIVVAQLTTLLTYLHRLKDSTLVTTDPAAFGSIVSQRFLQLVELHFREHWKVSDYAKEMGVTERRLESTLQRDLTESPISLIQRKLINEATLRLAHSPLSVSEIAYGLGFRDPAYFNRFFKRKIGQAPGAWRRKVKDKQITIDDSFAAWP